MTVQVAAQSIFDNPGEQWPAPEPDANGKAGGGSSSSPLVVTVDVGGSIQAVSQGGGYLLLGSEGERWLGRPFFDLVAESERGRLMASWERLQAGQGPDHWSVRMLTSDGLDVPVTLRAVPMSGSGSAHVLLISLGAHGGNVHDELEARNRKLAALNAVASTASSSLDLDEVMRRALARALEVVGAEAGAISLLDPATRQLSFRVQQGWHVNDFVRAGVTLDARKGLSGLVVSSGKTVVTGEVAGDQRVAVPQFRGEGVQAMVLAPLRASGKVLGVLGVMSYQLHRFTEDEVNTISAIADQIGVAIDNARLYEIEGRRRRTAEALQEISAVLASVLDLDSALQNALELLEPMMAYDSSTIVLFDGEEARVAAGRQPDGSGHPYWARRLAAVPALQTLADEDRPWLVGDVAVEENGDLAGLPGMGDEGTWIGTPLFVRGSALGALMVWRQEPNRYDEDDARALHSLGHHLGIAISNARLFEEVRRHVYERTALHEASLQVSASLDLWTILETVSTTVLRLTTARMTEVFLFDEEKQQSTFALALWNDGQRVAVGHASGPGALVVQAAQSTTPIVITDSRDAHLAGEGWSEAGICALVALPLRRAGQSLGVLVIAFDQPRTFSHANLRTMGLLAEQVAIGIDRTRLFTDLTQRSAQLRLINRIARRAIGTLHLSDLLDNSAEAIRESFGFFNVAFLMIDPADKRELVLRAIAGGYAMLMPPGYRQRVMDGIIGWVARHGETLLANDVSRDGRFMPLLRATKRVQAELAVPIKRGDVVIGVLDIQDLEPGSFNRHDVQAIETLADQLAVSIENARLYEVARRRIEEMSVLQEINLQLVAALDTCKVLELVTRSATRLCEAEDAYVFVYDSREQSLALGATTADSWQVRTNGENGAAGQFARRVLEAGKPLIANDPVQASDLGISSLPRSCRAVAGLPLSNADGLLGVLCVAHAQVGYFGPDEVRTLELLASQAAIALTNARLYEETRRQLEELRVLHEVALAATSSMALPEVAGRVVTTVQRALGSEYLRLFLAEDRPGRLELLAQAGEPLAALTQGQGVALAVESSTLLCKPDAGAAPAGGSYQRHGLFETAVPLKSGDRVIGIVEAASSRLGAFSEHDQRLLTTVAGLLSVVIENVRLYREMERRLSEVTALHDLARQVNTSLNVQSVLDTVVESILSTMKCRGVSLALLDAEAKVLEVRAAAGSGSQGRRRGRVRLGEGSAGRVALDGVPLYVPDTLREDGTDQFDPAVRALLCVPLACQGAILGTLTVESDRSEAFSVADERFLTIAAAQAAIAIENARLYGNLKQRAETLARAYEELREADRLKDELVHNVSHELRTPLTFVKGYVELLLEGDMGSLNDEQRASLKIVAHKTDAVTRLVSDMMFLQQADRMEVEIKPVHLWQVALRAVEGCRAIATEAGVQLTHQVPVDLPPVCGEEIRLSQVFDNLLGNAIKFSPEGGTIRIEAQDVGTQVRVAVSDTGIGIPADQLDRVFDRFYQVDGSATRHFGGTGLGLAIVRRIVEMYQGRVWAESKVGAGSIFFFTLPKFEA